MDAKKPTMDELRTRAEEALKSREDPSAECRVEDLHRLVYELRVHQVELELQNEELRSAHARLEESRMRYADLYDFAPVGYFTFDEQGRIIELNLTGAKQLGIERANLIDRPFAVTVVESDRKVFRTHLEKVFAGREGGTCEIRLKRKGGEEFYARLDSIFIQSADDTRLCRTSVTDISEKKRAEEALQKAHDKLDKLVEERTSELASEIVERKRAEGEATEYAQELERSNAELQDFAFLSSHDMQEPLRKIQIFGSRLMENQSERLNEEGRDDLKRMMKAARRMSAMVQSLLDYSQVVTRAEGVRRVDLTRSAQQAVNDLDVAIERQGARIEIGNLPEIEAEPGLIRKLFRNLIDNALKFHGEEAPLVRIRAELIGSRKSASDILEAVQCRIFIEDNGIGFDEKHLDRIFSLFEQLQGRSEYEGTGMGLAICRRIVQRHGGSITAKSKPGEGSIFIITIPVKQPGAGT